jgi:predicted glycosyltransferase
MKILIDIGHPGHVHFYRNAILEMKRRGHEVKITARDKEVVFQLLDAFKMPYLNRGEAYVGLAGKAKGLWKVNKYLRRIALEFKPDVLSGVHNPYIAQTAALIRKPSVIFTDTEHASLANILTFPFAAEICTPLWFKKDLGGKQVRYDGFKEQAYLSPKYFKPKESVLKKLGVGGEPYAVVRLVSWKAAHDFKQEGILNPSELIKKLEQDFRVYLSSESAIPNGLERYRLSTPPEDLQSVLYYARLCVSEGSTTATEAGLLGTPSVYVSSLVGTMGNFEELERLRLVHSFKTLSAAEPKIADLCKDKKAKKRWQKKSAKVMKEKTDVTKFITERLEYQGRKA